MHRETETAAEEIIGTILIVTVTVIMAAIIMAYASGMTQNVQMPYIVSVTVSHDFDGSPVLVYQGGQDNQYLTSLTTVYNDGTTEPWTGPIEIGTSVQVRDGERHVKVVGKFKGTTDQIVLDTNV